MGQKFYSIYKSFDTIKIEEHHIDVLQFQKVTLFYCLTKSKNVYEWLSEYDIIRRMEEVNFDNPKVDDILFDNIESARNYLKNNLDKFIHGWK